MTHCTATVNLKFYDPQGIQCKPCNTTQYDTKQNLSLSLSNSPDLSQEPPSDPGTFNGTKNKHNKRPYTYIIKKMDFSTFAHFLPLVVFRALLCGLLPEEVLHLFVAPL